METKKINLGRVGLVPKGAYSPDVTYGRMHVVTYKNTTYWSKQEGNTGHEPVGEDEWWGILVDGQAAYAGAFEAMKATERANTAAKEAERTNAAVWGAEQVRESAEEERKTAETQREEQAQSMAEAEQTRTDAEQRRAEAETQRVEAEKRRASEETLRAAAEDTRKSDEADRIAGETSREQQEESRVASEQTRDVQETQRKIDETKRADAETKRADAENTRKRMEADRENAETGRAAAETARVKAETARAHAETQRAAAETKRESDFSAKVKEVDTAVANAQTATSEAEKVDATITEANVFEVTGRDGVKKSLELVEQVEAASIKTDVDANKASIHKIENNIFTKADIDIELTPDIISSLFTKKCAFTNNGQLINSDKYVTSEPIYVGGKDYLCIDTEYDKPSLSFNIITLWDKDNHFLNNIQVSNKGVSHNEVLRKDVMYCRITLEKALINDNLKVRLTTKKPINEDYVLGGLKNRTNLIYSEIIGWSVLKGNLESAGQQNKKLCVIPVESGKTYYFYFNNNGKAESHSNTYAFSKLYSVDPSKISVICQNTGSGSSATASDGDLYLYVTYNKSSEAMISSSEQTEFFAADNDTYLKTLKVGEHDRSIAELQTKVYEHDSNITELQTKVGVGIELLKHPVFKEMTDTSVVISEATTSSSITDGTYYPILKDNKPHGEVSDLWRFSLPVQPNSGVYPKEYGIEVIRPHNIYLTTEFYFEGTEFEIREPANLSSYLIVDDVIVGTLSNTTNQAWVHQKVTFSESKKRHIRIRSSFYGINTKGVISKFEEKRMLLALDGDSITEGAACISPKHSEYAWGVRVAEILDCDLDNGGVGGSGYVKTGNLNQANMVDRYNSYIGQFNPDILFVMGGLNDGEATQNWKTAVDKYWEYVNSTFKGKYVIVASPYWPKKSKNDGITNMTDYLKGIALKYKYPFVDVYNGVTYDAMGQVIATNSNGGLVNSTNYNVLYKEYVEGTQTDSTHINNVTGHEYVGRYIANEIYRICKDDFGINL